MEDNYRCWKCGENLVDLILPMSRREECGKCSADQHVCKMCEFFDNRGRCEEDRAEFISDTERANFCDYFKPTNHTFSATHQDKSAQAKAKLAELFGDPLPETNDDDAALSPAELAEKNLRDMLG